jgi:hypothetical protein
MAPGEEAGRTRGANDESLVGSELELYGVYRINGVIIKQLRSSECFPMIFGFPVSSGVAEKNAETLNCCKPR